jgi:tRNA (Thr-GGU) A37 N-methylase
MVSGTPIIDIKPYHHLESVDMTNSKYPNWIKDKASEEQRVIVINKYDLIYYKIYII